MGFVRVAEAAGDAVKLQKMRNATIISFLLLTFCTLICHDDAQAQVRFYATAPKSVPVNQTFQLSFTIENGSGSNLKLPPLNDFQILGGPNTSTSMQWVNGQVTQSVSYTYILKPKAEGTYKIGKASVTVSGVNMESNELTIEVGKPVATPPQTRQPRGWDPFADDPFFNPYATPAEPEKSTAELQEELKDDVLMRVLVSKSSVYKGEMLTVTYKLYFRQNLTGFNVTKAPAFDGFWSQEVNLDPKRKQQVETYNGKQYYTIEVMKYNLYPQRDGTLTIPAIEVNTTALVQARTRSRSIFDDFFNMGRHTQVPLTLKTNTLTVQVKELPAGQPPGFQGAVGRYSFEARISAKETKTDEPITYSMKITGTGNLKFVEAPKLQAPEEFEVFEPKIKENITNSSEGLTGSKQYDYLLIPRQPGEYTLQAYTFSYFDPATAKYVTITSPEFTVKVTGAPSQADAGEQSNTATKQPVKTLGKDIRYLKTNTPDFGQRPFYGSWKFVTLYVSPFLIFAGLVALRKRHDALEADVVGAKRRKALKVAKQRLSKAEKFLATSDKKNFYSELSLGIWGYLSHKLNIDISELSKDNVKEKLSQRAVKSDTITALTNLLTACEQALYAPVGEGTQMKQDFETGLHLLADLEAEIK
ncbi:MAG: BatD family protein [Chitinophagales bacterium]|nr:BatD family protein [Chitinophagales bacterium]MDW8418435.1 BatD family protein [Chitinophagales bacterium]